MDFEAALAASDASTVAERAQRYEWLNRHGEPLNGRLLPGGPHSAQCMWEAGAAYVAGLYIGAILLTQACLEHLLTGWLTWAADEDRAHRRSYRELLALAHRHDLLSGDEFELFDRLRRERNPHAHPRAIDEPTALLRRAMDSGIHPDDLIKRDAENALNALVDLIDRPPFALGPRKAPGTD